MQVEVEEFVCHPKVIKKYKRGNINYCISGKRCHCWGSFTNKNSKSLYLSSTFFSKGSNANDSNLTFLDFERGLEQECFFDEINNIVRGNYIHIDGGCKNISIIKRASNPFPKNFTDFNDDKEDYSNNDLDILVNAIDIQIRN